jgi:hypothetical protein
VRGEAGGAVPNRGALTLSIMPANIMQGLDTTIANVAMPGEPVGLARPDLPGSDLLYRLPMIPRCSRVIRQVYHVWGMDDVGVFLSQ